jgi:hypothetical protein
MSIDEIHAGAGHHLDQHGAAGEMHHAEKVVALLELATDLILHVSPP